MIKFFRHIRQKLLSESNSSKYLLYAVGEIVLVVIGILIALQLNNWNSNRKNQVATKQLLRQLKEENQLNLNDLGEDYAYRDSIEVVMYRFNQFLKNENIEEQPEKLKNYLAAMLRVTTYSPSNNYLKKYISSNTGSNSFLASQLLDLDIDQMELQDISQKAFDIKYEKLYEFLAEDIDFETLEIHSFDKLKSLEFRNNLFLMESIEEGIFEKFEDAYRQQKIVDSLITLELQ